MPGGDPPFDIGIQVGDGHTLVTVSGEVDVFTAPRLREVLFDPAVCSQERVVVDLEGVSFIDSTGVGMLVAARRWTTSRGATLALVCTRGPTLRLLEIVGLDKVFEVHASAASALAP